MLINLMKQSKALARVKRLAQTDLSNMDITIKERLLTRSDLIQDITYHIVNSGGKRLRPTLLILVAKLFGCQGLRHINLAASVEFIHTATLLHDDVVDHSDLRRGKPTANQRWDNKSSILVGDFLFSQAFCLMAEDNDMQVLRILSTAASIIAEGEVNQLSSIANLKLSIDNYLQIITAKTAELFAAACQVGSVVALADNAIQQSMYAFGLNLGMAFQIIDDVLDYVANQATIGKNIGDDFREAKVTLPIILAYQCSNSEEKEFWHRAIQRKEQHEQDFFHVLEIFDKYNIIAQCLAIAEDFTAKAKQCIAIAPDNNIREALLEILDYSIKREN